MFYQTDGRSIYIPIHCNIYIVTYMHHPMADDDEEDDEGDDADSDDDDDDDDGAK